MKAFLERTGRVLDGVLARAGFGLELLFSGVLWLRHAYKRRRFLVDQFFTCTIRPLPVVLVVALFTGMILALQTGLELERFGAKERISSIVAVTLAREMGPFMTALILAASVGAGMAAEIGTMRVSEEIDALEVMSIRPESFLYMPRLVAMAVACPLLTLLTDVVGVFGGGLVSATRLDIDPSLYLDGVTRSLSSTPWVLGLPKDLYTGLVKALVFGVIIATVGTATGLKASGGAIGVGRATRMSVIVSFLLIIILGYYMTSLFYS